MQKPCFYLCFSLVQVNLHIYQYKYNYNYNTLVFSKGIFQKTTDEQNYIAELSRSVPTNSKTLYIKILYIIV